MKTATLTGPDLAYWVARANMLGHAQDRNVIRSHYGNVTSHDPSAEPGMRAFVAEKIGAMLPERSAWN